MNKLVTRLDFEIEQARRLKDSFKTHPFRCTERIYNILDSPYLLIDYIPPSKDKIGVNHGN